MEMRADTREIQALQADDRGRGHATALMWTTCAEADRAWLTLIVMPEPGTLERLKRFYSKFGFDEIQAEPCLMARDPQPPKIARMH
jgi:predicted GNAT family N-acyltransferase